MACPGNNVTDSHEPYDVRFDTPCLHVTSAFLVFIPKNLVLFLPLQSCQRNSRRWSYSAIRNGAVLTSFGTSVSSGACLNARRSELYTFCFQPLSLITGTPQNARPFDLYQFDVPMNTTCTDASATAVAKISIRRQAVKIFKQMTKTAEKAMTKMSLGTPFGM